MLCGHIDVSYHVHECERYQRRQRVYRLLAEKSVTDNAVILFFYFSSCFSGQTATIPG